METKEYAMFKDHANPVKEKQYEQFVLYINQTQYNPEKLTKEQFPVAQLQQPSSSQQQNINHQQQPLFLDQNFSQSKNFQKFKPNTFYQEEDLDYKIGISHFEHEIESWDAFGVDQLLTLDGLLDLTVNFQKGKQQILGQDKESQNAQVIQYEESKEGPQPQKESIKQASQGNVALQDMVDILDDVQASESLSAIVCSPFDIQSSNKQQEIEMNELQTFFQLESILNVQKLLNNTQQIVQIVLDQLIARLYLFAHLISNVKAKLNETVSSDQITIIDQQIQLLFDKSFEHNRIKDVEILIKQRQMIEQQKLGSLVKDMKSYGVFTYISPELVLKNFKKPQIQEEFKSFIKYKLTKLYDLFASDPHSVPNSEDTTDGLIYLAFMAQSGNPLAPRLGIHSKQDAKDNYKKSKHGELLYYNEGKYLKIFQKLDFWQYQKRVQLKSQFEFNPSTNQIRTFSHIMNKLANSIDKAVYQFNPQFKNDFLNLKERFQKNQQKADQQISNLYPPKTFFSYLVGDKENIMNKFTIMMDKLRFRVSFQVWSITLLIFARDICRFITTEEDKLRFKFLLYDFYSSSADGQLKQFYKLYRQIKSKPNLVEVLKYYMKECKNRFLTKEKQGMKELDPILQLFKYQNLSRPTKPVDEKKELMMIRQYVGFLYCHQHEFVLTLEMTLRSLVAL